MSKPIIVYSKSSPDDLFRTQFPIHREEADQCLLSQLMAAPTRGRL